MAFIRQVRTASGATAVQIAEYVSGRGQRIVEHVGSAHTPAELGVLLERARGLLADPGQQMLDFEVEASPPVAGLVPPPRERVLVPEPGVQQEAGRAGPGRVVATGSRLLFDALAGVYADLGFDAVADETFRDLVIARIVEPTSILDNGRVLTDLGQAPASEKTMRRTLARVTAGKYLDQIATACFEHAVTAGDVSLCLYDVTTLYFETDNEDGLRKFGYSKQRRVDPQIVVGLLVDRRGFPLEVGCFEGDTAKTTTIVPIIEQFAQRHHLADNRGRRRERRARLSP